jgi:hypothetical protein
MIGVLLAQNRDQPRHFYGARAVAVETAAVQSCDSDTPLVGDELAQAAQGCGVVISDRLAAGTREVNRKAQEREAVRMLPVHADPRRVLDDLSSGRAQPDGGSRATSNSGHLVINRLLCSVSWCLVYRIAPRQG